MRAVLRGTAGRAVDIWSTRIRDDVPLPKGYHVSAAYADGGNINLYTLVAVGNAGVLRCNVFWSKRM